MDKIINQIDRKIIYLVILCWLGVFTFLFIFILIKNNPLDFTVTNNYWGASIKWINSQPLASQGASGGFLYLPQSAILQIPFAILPARLAQILWLALNISLLCASCYYTVKVWDFIKYKNISFFVVSVITIALSYDSLRNGQINILMTALIVFIAYNLCNEKFRMAVFLCVIGVALKPHMIIPFLLLVGVYPKKCIISALVGIIILFCFPFFCQTSNYVIEQYRIMLTVFVSAQEYGHEIPWADLWGLLKVFGINISQTAIYLISFYIGIIIYLYSLFCLKKYNKGTLFIMMLSAGYILLFSGRTEMNTYCLIGPFMGVLIYLALLRNNRISWSYVILSLICWFFIFGANAVSGIIAPSLKSPNCPWTAPFAFIIYFCFTLYFIPKVNYQLYELKE